jgi:hypothetical protein
LLKKRRADHGIGTTSLIMSVASAIVPQPEIVLEAGIAELQHGVRQPDQIFRSIRTNVPRSVSRDVWSLTIAPPAVMLCESPNDLAVVCVPAVVDCQPGSRIVCTERK